MAGTKDKISTQQPAAKKNNYNPGVPGNKKSFPEREKYYFNGLSLGTKADYVRIDESQRKNISRGDVLEEARNLIYGDRAETHGDAKDNFGNIAGLWSVYLGHTVTAEDVALMMTLMKIARTKSGDVNMDDIIDAIGYLALGGELVSASCPMDAE